MPPKNKPLLILVAGPYRSNTGDDPEKIANNLHVMTAAGLQLFRLGHIPVTGEALALPLIEVAGSKQIRRRNFQRDISSHRAAANRTSGRGSKSRWTIEWRGRDGHVSMRRQETRLYGYRRN